MMKGRCIHAVSVTDASGAAIQHLEYMAFGEVFVDQRRTGFGTPYKFNAKELDCESGYYYYSARYYDPRMARFLSVDPLADAPANIGWSPYAYVWNNPLKFIDPDGMHGESTGQGHDEMGQIYSPVKGDPIMNDLSGEGNLPTITVTAKGKEKNESGSGFLSSLWSYFSGWVSTGSAKKGTEDGIEGLGIGGSVNTTEGRSDKIVNYSDIPGASLGGGVSGLLGSWNNYSQFSDIMVSGAYMAISLYNSMYAADRIVNKLSEPNNGKHKQMQRIISNEGDTFRILVHKRRYGLGKAKFNLFADTVEILEKK